MAPARAVTGSRTRRVRDRAEARLARAARGPPSLPGVVESQDRVGGQARPRPAGCGAGEQPGTAF